MIQRPPTVSVCLKPLQHYELLRLGRELHLNYNNLLALINSHAQPEGMLAAMLEVWLTSEEEGLKHYPPTWRRLSVALRNIGLSFIARKIVRDKLGIDSGLSRFIVSEYIGMYI